uniref:Ubiquitin-like domain-containing protein n=2 Tax=Mesocestoides corti TaxID=53468 RepID=A0A5K3F316_MESCO
MFEVNVKTLDGNSKTFQIDDEDLTVAAFKQLIATEMDIPIENQRLIFQGKVLVDERKLKDCDVESKTIHLVPRPPPQLQTDTDPSTSSTPGDLPSQPFALPNMLRFQGLRQAVQNVTQGLLSSLQDLGQPSDMAMRTDNEGNIDIRLDIPFLGLRENHFRRLHRQATSLLNSLDGIARTEPSENPQPQSTSSPASTGVNDQNSATEAASNATAPATPAQSSTVTFARLADMMAEQRRLWERLQPHLDQWEAMLRSEHEAQARISSSREVNATGSDLPLTPTPMEQEPMDVSESAPHVEWSQRFFNQVSFLLHQNSHMLHLLSDFAASTARTQTPTPTAPEPQASSGPSRTATPTTITSDAPAESAAAAVPPRQAHPRRTLVVPERESPVVYAHINIEPTVVTFTRPLGNMTAERAEPTTENASGEETPRRRSQSAHQPAPLGTEDAASESRPEGAAQGAFNLPTTFVIETPADASGQDPSQPQAFSAGLLLQSMFNQATQAPRQSPQQQQQQQPQPTQPQARVVNTASSGSTTESARAPLFLPHQLFPPSRRVGRGGDVGDPFLPCNSRHFAYLATGASARHRPRSTVGPTQRRGRSAGAHVDAPRVNNRPPTTTTPVTPSSGPTSNAPPPTTTVHSVSIPLNHFGTFSSATAAAGRNLNDIANQLTQALATGMGGLVQQSQQQPQQQRHATGGSFVLGPFTWVLNHPHGGGVQVVSGPSTAPTTEPTGSSTGPAYQELTGETQLTLLPGVLMEGALRTIWSFIADLAQNQLPPETAPTVDMSAWASPSAHVVGRWSRDSPSPFLQVLLHLRESLRTSGHLSSPNPNFPISSSLDHLRQPLRRLLPANFEADRDSTRDALASAFLADCISDEACADAPERELVAWAATICENASPVDLRRSLYNFLTHRIMSQMSLWYHSPTDSAFGSLLVMSLEQSVTDLFGFMDFLAQTAANRLGLSPESGVNVGGRVDTFGHSMSLQPLLQHLQRFTVSLPEDSDDRRLMYLLRVAMVNAMSAYCSLEASRLSTYTGSDPLSLIAYRQQPTPPAPLTSTTPPPVPPVEAKLKMETAEDSDVSDAYLDASEDAPMASADSATSTSTALRPPAAPPLPEWPADEHPPVNPLAENPDSAWRATSVRPPPMPSSFPQEWAALVASDVERMAGASSSSQASSPAATSTESEDLEVEELTGSVCRLSDAYIAGMPTKRRRLMLEKKHTLVCPADQLFVNLLTEAVSLTQAEGTAGDAVSASASLPPQMPPPREITEAFKTYVSDRLSARLANDPDFDPVRHPAARDTFGEKRTSKK